MDKRRIRRKAAIAAPSLQARRAINCPTSSDTRAAVPPPLPARVERQALASLRTAATPSRTDEGAQPFPPRPNARRRPGCGRRKRDEGDGSSLPGPSEREHTARLRTAADAPTKMHGCILRGDEGGKAKRRGRRKRVTRIGRRSSASRRPLLSRLRCPSRNRRESSRLRRTRRRPPRRQVGLR